MDNQYGAIVLCGGKSTRMGSAKALLPFGPELMLQRVVRIVGEVVPTENIVVVAAVGQELPELPSGVAITYDENPGRGPLEGLAAGLLALPENIEAAYATSCDVPLLVPGFVERLFALLHKIDNTEHDIAVAKDQKFHHPLAAVYRTCVLPNVEALLAADRLRPFFLFEECDTREVPVEELHTVDSHLRSLMNCNTPEEYEAALRVAGL
ncbi:molybdenum cofactor guanylyltransferase [Adhaeretor mobilis]|uniref:Probable molybdenum cofactor guanylyltransferase n=1 Tax=Adhaeretor mobilis TaxID=1930276 RepID=A0A517MPP4_9BACT|nr:molybdenum cofactor guanylyltransferase [Adhaeretor mobilis]QDS96849.1 molybdopterin-guanine dinucleotide biosynthesis protein A [Adhaeretor mobilis]